MKPLFTALFSLALAAPAARAQDTTRTDTLGVRRDTLAPDARVRAAAATLSELLAARVPGLQVRPGSGAVGSGSRLRLRGASGIDAPGELLVVVNGVRVVRDPANLAVALPEPYPSRLDDFVPDDIERLEVLSGPAAVARYGSEAVNGAIEVWTRRGTPGAPRLHAFAEAGVANETAAYPSSYGRLGRSANLVSSFCTLELQRARLCTPVGDSLLVFNAAEDGRLFRTGGRRRAGASVAGGTGAVTYQVGASGQHDEGVLRRDSRERSDVNGSFALHPGYGVEISGSALYIRNELELPAGGGDIRNPLLNASVENPFPATDPMRFVLTDTLGVTQSVGRTVARAAARWSPLAWLAVGGSYGIDDVAADETAHIYPFYAPQITSLRETGEGDAVRRNADVFASAEYGWRSALAFATTVGAERRSARVHGSDRVDVSADQGSENGFGLSNVTEAFFGRQRVAWRDRVSASLALRRESSDLAGGHVSSGSLGAEWDVGAEPFFPARGWIGGLRLRAAYARAEADAPENLLLVLALTPCNFPCDPVEPQRHSELEAGFDTELLDGRAAVSVTVYDRVTRGALGTTFRATDNVGHVTNRGAEARVTFGAGRTAPLYWELSAIGAANRNRVEDLAGNLGAVSQESIQQSAVGHPVGSFFARRLVGYEDLNGDGVLATPACSASSTAQCEVRVGTEFEYAGSPDPSRVLALQGRLRARGVELSALVDHQGGVYKRNLTDEVRCKSYRCRATYDPSVPLDEQARTAVAQMSIALVEDASFTRLREAALSYTLPQRWARGLGGRGAQLTVAGRNLLTWTPYRGLDPETNYDPKSPVAFMDAFTQPLPRTVTTRIDVSF